MNGCSILSTDDTTYSLRTAFSNYSALAALALSSWAAGSHSTCCRLTRDKSLIASHTHPRTELIVKNHFTRHGAISVAGWNKLPSSR